MEQFLAHKITQKKTGKTQTERREKTMGEKPASVPFYVYEAQGYKYERQLHHWQALTGIAAAVAVAALLLHKSSH